MGLDGFFADLLEAAGPLAPIGAQLLYLLEPLTGGVDGRVNKAARILEDPERVAGLVARLRDRKESR